MLTLKLCPYTFSLAQLQPFWHRQENVKVLRLMGGFSMLLHDKWAKSIWWRTCDMVETCCLLSSLTETFLLWQMSIFIMCDWALMVFSTNIHTGVVCFSATWVHCLISHFTVSVCAAWSFLLASWFPPDSHLGKADSCPGSSWLQVLEAPGFLCINNFVLI